MSTRALVLSGCMVLLLLSVATGLNDSSSPKHDASHSVSNSDQAVHTDSLTFKRLQAVYGATRQSAPVRPSTPPIVPDSTLWLARAIYSETKLPHEQELVGWVVRNRVETQYRGNSSYREVVLDPYQFSAFNPGSSRRQFYTSLAATTNLPAWKQALWIAYYVQHADPMYRPFSVETRHFYSERSMRGRRSPRWATRGQFVSIGWNYRVDERRFRFFEEIS